MTAVVFSATDAVALLVTVGVWAGVGDGDGQGLAVGVGAVRDLHGDVIDVVGIRVGGRLVVRRADETQGAGGAIDAEKGHIGAAAEAVRGRGTGIRIGGSDRRDGGCVLGHKAEAGTAPLLVMTGALSLTSVTLLPTWVAVKLPSG